MATFPLVGAACDIHHSDGQCYQNTSICLCLHAPAEANTPNLLRTSVLGLLPATSTWHGEKHHTAQEVQAWHLLGDAAERGVVGHVGEAVGEHRGERRGERTPLASVTFLHQLNEVQDGLLLAGTADGALRVWRNYALKAEQRLATAWQVGGPLCCLLLLGWCIRMPGCFAMSGLGPVDLWLTLGAVDCFPPFC